MATELATSDRAESLSTAADTPARVVAITSGKGGVGKTMVSANLAASLARKGHRVLVLDADLGLANLDVVLNLQPTVTLHDVVSGRRTLPEALIQAPGGFSVLLAGSGMVEYSRLTPEVRDKLIAILSAVSADYDYILLDTGAGISDVVLFTVSLADDVLVVATPEPTSLTDAYATIKVLATTQQRHDVLLVVNQIGRPGEGLTIRQQLQGVVDRYVSPLLDQPIRIRMLGEVPLDTTVRDAVRKRRLVTELAPSSHAAVALGATASRLVSWTQPAAAAASAPQSASARSGAGVSGGGR
jgi:flagellar biosynthesis protein FlhG